MNDIENLLNVYKSRLSNKIKELAKPLETHFGIDEFIYTWIGQDGRFFAISNQPSPSEFYFSSRFFESTLLIRHPDNFQDSVVMPIAIAEEKQESEMDDKFGLSADNLLVIFKKDKIGAHKFLFNTTQKGISLVPFYLNNIQLFKTFCDHFLKEWQPFQDEMEKYIIDIGSLIGPKFYEISPLIQVKEELNNKMAFLKKIGAIPNHFEVPENLSSQETVCLKWIYQGKTIKEAASLMHLSPRTVEYYFNNIKNKLNCYSKLDVMDTLQHLHLLGIF